MSVLCSRLSSEATSYGSDSCCNYTVGRQSLDIALVWSVISCLLTMSIRWTCVTRFLANALDQSLPMVLYTFGFHSVTTLIHRCKVSHQVDRPGGCTVWKIHHQVRCVVFRHLFDGTGHQGPRALSRLENDKPTFSVFRHIHSSTPHFYSLPVLVYLPCNDRWIGKMKHLPHSRNFL